MNTKTSQWITRTTLWLLLLLELTLNGPKPAAATGDPDFTPLLDTIKAEMTAQQVPGLAVAVIYEGKVVFSQGFGVRNTETNDPVTPATLFRIGSTTKPLTAIGLLQLAEAGQVDLDAPVVQYVPEFRVNPQITVRQVLSHSSGLGDAATSFGRLDPAALKDYVAGLTPESAFALPGEYFSYSNPGFDTAGRVIEAVSGMAYADYMAERVFPALGMTRTTLSSDMAMTYPLAVGYAPGPSGPEAVRPNPNNVAEYPAGFVFSSVEDLARLAQFLINDGQLDGKPVLSAELVQAMKTPVITVEPAQMGYGLGLFITQERGQTVVEHSGNIPGSVAAFDVIPSQGLAVIVLANTSRFLARPITQAALDIFLPSSADAPPDPPALDATALTVYEGEYQFPHALPQAEPIRVTVSVKDSQLLASQPGMETPFDLRPIRQDAFEVYWPGAQQPIFTAAFLRDKTGQITFLNFGYRAFRKVE